MDMKLYHLHNTGAEVQEAIDDVREKTIYENATEEMDGLMSKEDKTKLNGIVDGGGVEDEELTIEEIDNLLNF